MNFCCHFLAAARDEFSSGDFENVFGIEHQAIEVENDGMDLRLRHGTGHLLIGGGCPSAQNGSG